MTRISITRALSKHLETRISLETAIAFGLAMFVFAVTPGPGILATVARSIASGFWTGFGFTLGIITVDFLFVLLAVFGLSMIAEYLGEVFFVVKLAGGGYLVWLGWKTWTATPVLAEPAVGTDRGGIFRGWTEGVLITLGNPKVIIFYGALLPTFVDLATLDGVGLAQLLAIIATVLLITNNSFALLASRARGLLRSQRSVCWMNRGAGSVMVGAGIAVATR
ncbi:MAG: LysE family translocator [Rhodospirillaceae bacterium]|nr:LysE family translocator [Rhodospirillaceae bacterium]